MMIDDMDGDGSSAWEPRVGALIGGVIFGSVGSMIGYAMGKLWSSSKGIS